MTLKEIEIFINLASTQNMLQTAKEMNLSQSAISLSIKNLEKKLNTTLFDRIGKKLILNENGRVFLEKIKKPFFEIKEAKNIFRNTLNANIKIAASKTIGNYILPKKIFNFLQNYPNINIKKEITNSTNIINKVINGEVDIGLIEKEVNEIDIKKEIFAKDRLIFVSKDKIDECFIDNLFDKKWILREKGSGTREMFLNAICEFKENLNIFIECNDFEEIKEFLEFENTITCISEYVVQKELKEKKLFKVEVKNLNLQRNFYIIYHKNKFISKSLKTFIKYLKD